MEDPDEPRIWAGWFEVPVAVGLDAAPRRAEVHRRLVADLRSRAETRLPSHLTEVCARLGIERPPILVREQRRGWGSCDASGVLRINWRILQAPVSLVEYVLVHELAHLRFADHGAAFWNLVGRWMPDYEQRRQRLRQLGPALEW